jgi:hypothetical protein
MSIYMTMYSPGLVQATAIKSGGVELALGPNLPHQLNLSKIPTLAYNWMSNVEIMNKTNQKD